MTLRIRLVRWFLANALLAGISFLCAGGVTPADIEAISRGLCADGISKHSDHQAGLWRGNEASRLQKEPIQQFDRCERLVHGDGRFRGPRCGKASLDIPISQRSADGGICRIYCGQCSSNLGDGGECLLFDGASPSGGAGPSTGKEWPLSLRSTSRLSRDVAHCAFDGLRTWLEARTSPRINVRGAHFIPGRARRLGSSSEISPVMPIISEEAPYRLIPGVW